MPLDHNFSLIRLQDGRNLPPVLGEFPVRWGRWPGVIACLWLCAGCGMPVARLPDLPAAEVAAEQRRQQVAQIRDYYAQLSRLDNVAFRIRVANRRFCKKTAPRIGLRAATVRSLPRKYRSYTHEALQIGWDKPAAISVAKGSPAAVAGIKTGDEILTLDNTVVPATGTTAWMEKWLAKHDGLPVDIMMRRDGTDTLRTVYPVTACAIPIRYKSDPDPNAQTDGSKIVIQSGILRVARTDAELAVVVGHELAHVNMGHYGKKLRNAVIGRIGGAVVDGGFMLGGIYTGRTFSNYFGRLGAQAFSVEFEREADYVGAYYAARAGYDVAGAAEVWRAMALERPDAILIGATHPITPARFVQMQKVAAEIADKNRRHLPLVPELRQVPQDDGQDLARQSFSSSGNGL
jgi:Zn-dependent protease with chaperone function